MYQDKLEGGPIRVLPHTLRALNLYRTTLHPDGVQALCVVLPKMKRLRRLIMTEKLEAKQAEGILQA